MAFNRFSLNIIVRIIVLVLASLGLIYALSKENHYSLSLLTGTITIGLFYELLRYINHQNEQLTRFIEAAKHDDFGQKLEHFIKSQSIKGTSFEALARSISEVKDRLQTSRQSQQTSLLHQKALIEHIPVPLVSLLSDGSVKLHNNAARKLFGLSMPTHIEDLSLFGDEFYLTIKTIAPGERKLVNFSYDNINQQLSIAASQFIAGSDNELLISMQDIQSELDKVQLRAWQDLVSVLTHEIMNSITPVSSLVKTTFDMVHDLHEMAKENILEDNLPSQIQPVFLEHLTDIRRAMETVTKRSDGLLRFVENYQSLTKIPVPNRKMLSISHIFTNIEKLVGSQMNENNIQITFNVEPSSLQVFADIDLIEQVLINLIKNAQQAMLEQKPDKTNKIIQITSHLNQRGNTVIQVMDNGPGIPQTLSDQIFIPFFTTKKEGSGVGLALTRQIMDAHGGSVTLKSSELDGTTFFLIF